MGVGFQWTLCCRAVAAEKGHPFGRGKPPSWSGAGLSLLSDPPFSLLLVSCSQDRQCWEFAHDTQLFG